MTLDNLKISILSRIAPENKQGNCCFQSNVIEGRAWVLWTISHSIWNMSWPCMATNTRVKWFYDWWFEGRCERVGVPGVKSPVCGGEWEGVLNLPISSTSLKSHPGPSCSHLSTGRMGAGGGGNLDFLHILMCWSFEKVPIWNDTSTWIFKTYPHIYWRNLLHNIIPYTWCLFQPRCTIIKVPIGNIVFYFIRNMPNHCIPTHYHVPVVMYVLYQI